MDDVANIKKFNQFVERTIREDGTCKIVEQYEDGTDRRIAVFERSGRGHSKFVGWWDDDHSQMTYADTPYQVYCDMPCEEDFHQDRDLTQAQAAALDAAAERPPAKIKGRDLPSRNMP